MSNFMAKIRDSRLHTKLLITYLILLLITVSIFSISDYRLNRDTLLEMAQKDVYTIVRKNNELIDVKMSRIREMIYGFTEDSDFYRIIAELDPNDETGVLAADLEIKNILNKYFAQSQDLYSVQVAAPYYVFGNASSANSEHAKNFIPIDGFAESRLKRIAQEAEGRTEWVATYDFAEMFGIEYLKPLNYDYKYLFSAVTHLQGSYLQENNRKYEELPEKPILVLNFKDTMFKNIFEDSIPVEGNTYFVMDENGYIVSHPDSSKLSTRFQIPELDEIMHASHGVRMLKIDGSEKVVAFAKSEVTGWMSMAFIPPSELLEPVVQQYMRNLLISIGIITLLFLTLSVFLSRLITQPFRLMIRAIANTGEGRFETRFEEKGSYEFKVLMKKFNDMNENIKRLIQDNYELQIREKEAEIKALNMQLDPHFMYNTLNMVSLMALEKGEMEVSEVVISLSNMMKYMVKTDTAQVSFRDDLSYLQGYVTIMGKRFEGVFQVEYQIDPEMLDNTVPKFFLQPLVENAFVHGFKQMKSGGILRISCYYEAGVQVYKIEDNGAGMDASQLGNLMTDHHHVGMANVDRRIRILYGDQYGIYIQSVPGQGTTVMVSLPAGREKVGLV
ncbi:sensor histidine kinase [Paenibacillus nanensis]|uniref:Sensor histidine kinase n=1 Tax=Paenibacillus nanensis TaxID=393251 RepID=A0A3A1VH39_9BACL|nr:histidine kinase [Paenibacillus nanensis]RIX59634.1 sensor histidine kinase [Paenibacillus nanensis]